MSEDLVQAVSEANKPHCDQLHAVLNSTPSDFAFTKSLLGANAEFQKAQSHILELEETLVAARVAMTHDVPRDCWATGPLTGDEHEDLVVCPGCKAIRQIGAVLAKRYEE